MVLPTVDWVFLHQSSRQPPTDMSIGQSDLDSPSVEIPFSNVLGCVTLTVKLIRTLIDKFKQGVTFFLVMVLASLRRINCRVMKDGYGICSFNRFLRQGRLDLPYLNRLLSAMIFLMLLLLVTIMLNSDSYTHIHASTCTYMHLNIQACIHWEKSSYHYYLFFFIAYHSFWQKSFPINVWKLVNWWRNINSS